MRNLVANLSSKPYKNIRIKTFCKIFFVGVLEVTDEKNRIRADPELDPLVKGTDPRIRIRANICHGSGSLVQSKAGKKEKNRQAYRQKCRRALSLKGLLDIWEERYDTGTVYLWKNLNVLNEYRTSNFYFWSNPWVWIRDQDFTKTLGSQIPVVNKTG